MIFVKSLSVFSVSNDDEVTEMLHHKLPIDPMKVQKALIVNNGHCQCWPAIQYRLTSRRHNQPHGDCICVTFFKFNQVIRPAAVLKALSDPACQYILSCVLSLLGTVLQRSSTCNTKSVRQLPAGIRNHEKYHSDTGKFSAGFKKRSAC